MRKQTVIKPTTQSKVKRAGKTVFELLRLEIKGVCAILKKSEFRGGEEQVSLYDALKAQYGKSFDFTRLDNLEKSNIEPPYLFGIVYKIKTTAPNLVGMTVDTLCKVNAPLKQLENKKVLKEFKLSEDKEMEKLIRLLIKELLTAAKDVPMNRVEVHTDAIMKLVHRLTPSSLLRLTSYALKVMFYFQKLSIN